MMPNSASAFCCASAPASVTGLIAPISVNGHQWTKLVDLAWDRDVRIDLEGDGFREPHRLLWPGGLLAGGALSSVAKLALSNAVGSTPARLVTWSSSAHGCPPCRAAGSVSQALAAASFSAPRSLALRARRLRATSSGVGVITPL